MNVPIKKSIVNKSYFPNPQDLYEQELNKARQELLKGNDPMANTIYTQLSQYMTTSRDFQNPMVFALASVSAVRKKAILEQFQDSGWQITEINSTDISVKWNPKKPAVPASISAALQPFSAPSAAPPPYNVE